MEALTKRLTREHSFIVGGTICHLFFARRGLKNHDVHSRALVRTGSREVLLALARFCSPFQSFLLCPDRGWPSRQNETKFRTMALLRVKLLFLSFLHAGRVSDIG